MRARTEFQRAPAASLCGTWPGAPWPRLASAGLLGREPFRLPPIAVKRRDKLAHWRGGQSCAPRTGPVTSALFVLEAGQSNLPPRLSAAAEFSRIGAWQLASMNWRLAIVVGVRPKDSRSMALFAQWSDDLPHAALRDGAHPVRAEMQRAPGPRPPLRDSAGASARSLVVPKANVATSAFVASSMRGLRSMALEHRPRASCQVVPGEGETRMPAASIAAILSSAPPLPPEMIAPAWPMRRPGGAVRPAMKPAIGFLRPRLASSIRNCAASSSADAADLADHDDRLRCPSSARNSSSTSMKFGAVDRIAADADSRSSGRGRCCVVWNTAS